MTTTVRNIIMLTGLIIGVLGIINGYDAWQSFSTKAEQQEIATLKMKRWNTAYSSLQPISGQWDDEFETLQGVIDHLTIYSIMGLAEHGLHVDPDNISVRHASENRMKAEVKVGLHPLCIGSANGALDISAESLPGLLQGLEDLASQKDVRLGKVILETRRPKEAKVFDFCILVQV